MRGLDLLGLGCSCSAALEETWPCFDSFSSWVSVSGFWVWLRYEEFDTFELALYFEF
jgi:hypothetical protein